jgi:hypothetical protein
MSSLLRNPMSLPRLAQNSPPFDTHSTTYLIDLHAYLCLLCSRHISATCVTLTTSHSPLSFGRMAARTHFPPSHACTCALVSSTAFYSASLGFRPWSLGQLALAVRIFCFSVLLFSPPFCLISMPCFIPLIPLRPCPYLCPYVPFAKQYNTDPLCLGLFSDYRNQRLLCLTTGSTHHRVKENVMGFYSCLSCDTAPDCFGKLLVAGT